ncbi:MAG: peptide/nickel transport system ATP-binding [Planctomycetota bacterium]|nr:MAG: peptide/nickel transport system ATP-binding [Planctomycetota bacterium]
MPLLEVKELVKHFPVKKGVFSRTVGHVRAVDGVSFSIGEGRTLGLVGESGCGKTTVGRTLLRLIEPTSGEVAFEGRHVMRLAGAELRAIRRHMQIIFQDPYSSLNPRMTVGSIVEEGMKIHGLGNSAERVAKVRKLLRDVGLMEEHINRYPHEFSGGQRQRIGIARALAVEPKFIVCDEAVSALDVSIQAQVVNLLAQMKKNLGLSYLFISHDLSVVEHISDDVAVMYLGEIVETAPKDEIFRNPLHPYTQALLSAVPQPDPANRKNRIILTGDVPSPVNPPNGCRFHPRCPKVMPECQVMVPPAYDMGGGHVVRCLLYDPKFAGLRPTPNPDLISTGQLQPGVAEMQKRKATEVAHPAIDRGTVRDETHGALPGAAWPKPPKSPAADRPFQEPGPLERKLPSKEVMDKAVRVIFGVEPSPDEPVIPPDVSGLGRLVQDFPVDEPPTTETPTPIILHPPDAQGNPKKPTRLDEDPEEPPPGPGDEPPTKIPEWLQ